MKRKVLMIQIVAAILMWLVVGSAWAVTLEVDLQSEGDPVPNAVVTFETEDGEAIGIALVAGHAGSPSSDSDNTPDSSTAVDVAVVADAVNDDKAPDQDKAGVAVTASQNDQPQVDAADKSGGVATDASGKLIVEIGEMFLGKDVFVTVRRGDRVKRLR